MKKLFSVLLVIALVLTSTVVTASASESLTNISGVLEFDTEGITVSEPMTYEEMMAKCYQNYDGPQYQQYEALTETANAQATYRTFSLPLNVTSTYVPKLDFYCETSEYGQYWGIVSIYSVQMNRAYNGISKQFSGTVDVWLRSAYQIEYIVNGDFYDNGTTTVSGNIGLQLKLDEYAQINFGVTITSSSSHYAYFYEPKLVSFQY